MYAKGYCEGKHCLNLILPQDNDIKHNFEITHPKQKLLAITKTTGFCSFMITLHKPEIGTGARKL